ncbi:MAG: 6-pyruvoyl-tetrahydropterin synthase-related protein [Caldilineales bacterium]
MALYRALLLDRAFEHWRLYPRLAMDLNFTYGTPLFQYYPPLVSYLMQPFHWIGLSWVQVAKATAAMMLMLAAVGMYIYARWLFSDRRAALVSAAAYLLAPYLLTTIYDRGAVAEALAMAWLPWLFWATHHILATTNRLWVWLASLFCALLVLSHTLTALFALPVMIVFLALLAWRERALGRLPAVLIALVLGLGLSTFYWLPAFLERDYAQISTRMLGGHYSTDNHLTPLKDLIQRSLVADHWGAMRFRLSLWQALLAGAAIAALALRRGPGRRVLLLLAAILLTTLFVQLDINRRLWHALPLVGFIQFPWRLLGIAGFCVALLVGSLLTLPRLSGVGGSVLGIALLLLMLYGSTARLAPVYAADYPVLADEEITLTGMFERARTVYTPFSDFLPVAVTVDPWDLPRPRPVTSTVLPPMPYVPTLAITQDGGDELEIAVHADQPFTLRLHRFYFPGWRVLVDGQPVPTAPSGELGLVTADLPAGDYTVAARFGETPLRLFSDVISIVALLIFVAGGLLSAQTRPLIIGLGAGLVMVTLLLAARQGAGEPPRRPVAYPANFGEQIHLLGYDLPDTIFSPGDDVDLHLYWLAQRAGRRLQGVSAPGQR